MGEPRVEETKPRKVVGRSIAIALGIVCVILVVALGVVTFMGYSPTVANSVPSLQSRYDIYVSEHGFLNVQYGSLQGALTEQIATYNTYVDDHNYTNEQYTNLQNQIASDNSAINSLTSQNANLQLQYTGLQANYSQLMQDYQAALAKIPSDRGITIDAVNYTQGSGVTGVVIRNLGVNATTVTSLKLYWTNEGVLSSSASVNVVIPGNSTASIQTSLPINGWNTVYDTWILKIQTLEGYNATSDPLMLIL